MPRKCCRFCDVNFNLPCMEEAFISAFSRQLRILSSACKWCSRRVTSKTFLISPCRVCGSQWNIICRWAVAVLSALLCDSCLEWKPHEQLQKFSNNMRLKSFAEICDYANRAKRSAVYARHPNWSWKSFALSFRMNHDMFSVLLLKGKRLF